MAIVTLTLEDQHENGDAVVGLKIKIEGAQREAPATDAMIMAAAISRLFKSGALEGLIPLICGDLMFQRRQAATAGASNVTSLPPKPASSAAEAPASPPAA